MTSTVYVGTSLDGFIAKKDGSIDWLAPFENEEIGDSYRQFISTIDAVVIGRGTFEKILMSTSWPYEKNAFLLSTSMTRVPEMLKEKVMILSMKPKEVLSYLSGKGFSNVYVDGGKVIQGFLREDCIDELIITRVPVLIGSGIPLFDSLDKTLEFTHVGTDVYSNGLVKSRYKRKRAQ